MARILGKDITRRDILPMFEEYCTKDIDDVKIGALTHLADFFEVSNGLSHTVLQCSVCVFVCWTSFPAPNNSALIVDDTLPFPLSSRIA